MPIHASQVAAAQRDAVTIEEFENLDRDLAAVVKPIAELRGRELSLFRGGGYIGRDSHHLGDGRAR